MAPSQVRVVRVGTSEKIRGELHALTLDAQVIQGRRAHAFAHSVVQ